MKKKNDDILLALKRARKESREEEIRTHGKPICYTKVYKSKKNYTRKRKHKTDY